MLGIHRMNWDDVRIFLATMRAGSLRQVAEDLGISHPTASRRLSALERRMGLVLFHRGSHGLEPTPEALELMQAAQEVERAMLALERVAAAADPALRGPVRLTTSMALATDLLMPDLLAFQHQYPELSLDVAAGSGIQDLAQREADVAIRILPMGSSPAKELAGRKAAVAYRAVYGSGESWIGWQGGPRSLRSQDPELSALPIRSSMRGIALQRAACAAGFGLAWLPCFYAEPLLERRTEPEPGGEIWVLVHPDLRKNPRLRVFRDRMVEVLKRYQPRLAGNS